MNDPKAKPEGGAGRDAWRLVLIATIVVVVALAAFWAPTPEEALELAMGVADRVDANPWTAATVFVLIVTLGKIPPLPGYLAFLLCGGFLFGTFQGGLLASLGGACSAVIVATLGRQFVPERFLAAESGLMPKLRELSKEHGFGILVALRLLPIIPAWAVNVYLIVTVIPRTTVLTASFVGLLPVSVAIASGGAQLREVAELETFDVSQVLTTETAAALVFLAAIVLLGVVFKARLPRDAEK